MNMKSVKMANCKCNSKQIFKKMKSIEMKHNIDFKILFVFAGHECRIN